MVYYRNFTVIVPDSRCDFFCFIPLGLGAKYRRVLICRNWSVEKPLFRKVHSAILFSVHRGRINESSLQEAISSLDRSQLTCYICGPPPMIKHVTDILRKLNIAETRIHFEKWW